MSARPLCPVGSCVECDRWRAAAGESGEPLFRFGAAVWLGVSLLVLLAVVAVGVAIAERSS